MFVIMLLVHVVIIGGIIIYDFIGDGTDAKVAALTASKSNSAKQASTPKRAESHLPTVADTTPAPEPVKATPPAPSPESLLPEAAKSTAGSPPAPTSLGIVDPTDAPKAQAFAAPAPAPLSVKGPADEPKLNRTIVSLPPAPKEESKVITTSTAPPVKREAEKPKPTNEEARRAVMLGSSTPSHVPTPSEARKSVEKDSHPTPAPTVKKKVADAPPAPAAKKKTEDTPPAPKKKSDNTATTKSKSGSSAGAKHTVGKGDTLWSIARKYKTTPDAIIKANGIKNPDVLPDGKVLVIPAK
jgi:LysM repeat protein